MLSGLKESIPASMYLCSYVKDKCCSIADEIKISKFWRDRTLPVLNQHVDEVLYLIGRLIEIFRSFINLNPADINVKYK